VNDKKTGRMFTVLSIIASLAVDCFAGAAFGLSGFLGVAALCLVGGGLIYRFGVRQLIHENLVHENVLTTLLTNLGKTPSHRFYGSWLCWGVDKFEITVHT
jgi:hypothetical protein